MSRLIRALVAAALSAIMLSIGAAPSHAAFGFASLSGEVANADGSAATQAGAHPHAARLSMFFNTHPHSSGFGPATDGDVRDVIVDLPPGFVGNPLATPRCNEQQIQEPTGQLDCPAVTQVGVATIDIGGGPSPQAIFNMVPPRGTPAQFAFNIAGVIVHMNARLRENGNYGVSIDTKDISQSSSLLSVAVSFWGIPADSSHDGERTAACLLDLVPGDVCPSGTTRVPLLTNPGDCSAGPLTTWVLIRSWENPVSEVLDGFDEDVNGVPMAVEGCERLPFDPSIDVTPDVSEPDSPTALAVDIRLPQDGTTNPTGLATAHLKRATVTLPEGMTISPSAASGLQACSDAQLGAGTERRFECPEASKIGTASARTPLLDEPLEGGVYVGSQLSDDPASGRMFRIFLRLLNERYGIDVRLRGEVRVNPATGRLETTFDNNPQLPVSEISLRLKGGPRAPLATPPTCGTKTTVATFTSWSGHSVERSDAFTVACPASIGFTPAFIAGTRSPSAGSFSPFVARIVRDDRQGFLSGVRVEMPGGLLARLAGVEKCGSVQAEHGGCPVGSRIGTATVGAGPGSTPFYVQGPVFLTESYKGAPFGMAVHVHAKAGPFDLGWVRVRQALQVDRSTAQVSVVSDPLPQVVKGVPVRLRSVDVDVDREDFTINPTSCSEKRVGATLTSIDGAVHKTGSRFQVGDCAALPFRPRLGLALKGRRQHTTGRHPAVRAVVRQSGVGEAGIRRARVVLPGSLALDPENAQALCEFEDGTKPDLENHCPAGSKVGRARAKTPLLGRDLAGDVYFVKNVRRDPDTGNPIRTLPMLVVALRGEIAINLVGESDTARNGRLVNTFKGVPDAPISRFNLNIRGGQNGILAVTGNRRGNINLCAKPRSHRANTAWRGHNGKRANYRVRVKTPCGKRAKRRAAAKRKAAAKNHRAATNRRA